ncbi:ParB/RepB/Spo0J family partition protein [Vogesella mureinivorans]|jgi:ParB family chromosome partitioning protein|uniref:ParB/RepB/Spo0J family partition protein n=1 Tax=Vogesella mureinivorans TaxID=657276 RepID=UPI0011CB67DD|nr:ParB/RepB/Spo0J family partition protein [Vogesella mureinivorans]
MAKLKGLGRGLDALLSTVESDNERLTTLPVSSIRPGKYQPRSHMDETALAELAASIRSQGLIQPIVVREIGLGDYELIAGERRWRASQLAGLTDIPAVVRSVADQSALAMGLIENIQRQQLDPLEEAKGIKRLIEEFGLTHEGAADALGRSRSAISNLLRLLALPAPLQTMLHEGQLEMGHARALLPLPVLQQMALAQAVVAEQLSVREVEQRVQALAEPKVGRKAAAAAPRDADIERLAGMLSDKLGMSVSFRHGSKGKGKVIIDYASLDELDGLLEKLQAKSTG